MIVSAVFWSELTKERITEQIFSISENAETASLFNNNDITLNFLFQIKICWKYKRAQNVRDTENTFS